MARKHNRFVQRSRPTRSSSNRIRRSTNQRFHSYDIPRLSRAFGRTQTKGLQHRGSKNDISVSQIELRRAQRFQGNKNCHVDGFVEELRKINFTILKVMHLNESNLTFSFENDDQEEYSPFPSLEQVLQQIDPQIGFNIEIKYNSQLEV